MSHYISKEQVTWTGKMVQQVKAFSIQDTHSHMTSASMCTHAHIYSRNIHMHYFEHIMALSKLSHLQGKNRVPERMIRSVLNPEGHASCGSMSGIWSS